MVALNADKHLDFNKKLNINYIENNTWVRRNTRFISSVIIYRPGARGIRRNITQSDDDISRRALKQIIYINNFHMRNIINNLKCQIISTRNLYKALIYTLYNK